MLASGAVLEVPAAVDLAARQLGEKGEDYLHIFLAAGLSRSVHAGFLEVLLAEKEEKEGRRRGALFSGGGETEAGASSLTDQADAKLGEQSSDLGLPTPLPADSRPSIPLQNPERAGEKTGEPSASRRSPRRSRSLTKPGRLEVTIQPDTEPQRFPEMDCGEPIFGEEKEPELELFRVRADCQTKPEGNDKWKAYFANHSKGAVTICFCGVEASWQVPRVLIGKGVEETRIPSQKMIQPRTRIPLGSFDCAPGWWRKSYFVEVCFHTPDRRGVWQGALLQVKPALKLLGGGSTKLFWVEPCTDGRYRLKLAPIEDLATTNDGPAGLPQEGKCIEKDPSPESKSQGTNCRTSTRRPA